MTTASTLEVRSPYDGSSLGEVPLASASDLDKALDRAARLHGDADGGLPRPERISVLRRASLLVRQRRDDLALTIAREGGKPLVDARIEVDRAAGGIEYLAGEVERLAGEEIPMGATAATESRLAVTTMEPIGVVAAISAFNHPVNLIAHQVGPAIAAGCPVLVKPALETPLSCRALLDIFHEAGLPPGWATMVTCEHEVGERLVRSERIAYLSFIGSAAVGWKLRSQLAPGVRCGLEHGGAAPVIVDETADLDRCLPMLEKGGYYHAGQVCVSVQRVFVHRARLAETEGRLAERARTLRVGDPESDQTEVGPLIRAKDVDRVASWVDEAVAGGAHLAAGGKKLDHQCYAPTLLVQPPDDSRVMTEEVFGPVVCLTAFDDLDEAIRRANAVRWAFQAAIMTQDVTRALRAARRLDASTVLINDHTAFRADWMPFGGRRASGLGVGGMPYSVRELCAPKLIVLRG